MTSDDALPPLPEDTIRVARIAIAEDGDRDVTSESLGLNVRSKGRILIRQDGVVAGLAYAQAVCDQLRVSISWHAANGDMLNAGAAVGAVEGPLVAVLRAERPLLNLLQRASGIATTTRAYVNALASTSCLVLHTRKTTPGLRAFEVRAVIAGGGQLHRVGLATQLMIKDNHWQALKGKPASLGTVLGNARERGATRCAVEVEDRDQVKIAVAAGATRLLIDNRSVEEFGMLAALARELNGSIQIEATGGLTLDNVRAYAEAGADFVSIGALTHSVRAVDLGLELETS